LRVRQMTVDVTAGGGDDDDDDDDGSDDDADSTSPHRPAPNPNRVTTPTWKVHKTLLRNCLPSPPTSSTLPRGTPSHKLTRVRCTVEIRRYQSRNRDHFFNTFSFRAVNRSRRSICTD